MNLIGHGDAPSWNQQEGAFLYQSMPNMMGRDFAKELMSIRSDTPIILGTGFGEQIDEDRAKDMGFGAYVIKPIVMRQIANTNREVLDKN